MTRDEFNALMRFGLTLLVVTGNAAWACAVLVIIVIANCFGCPSCP